MLPAGSFSVSLPRTVNVHAATRLLLAACTAHEKQVIKELEDMPGITCTTNAKDQTHCGPDSLSVTADPQ